MCRLSSTRLFFYRNDADGCPGERQRAIAHTIALADLIACVSGYEPWGRESAEMLLAHDSAQYLGLTDVKLACIRVDLEDRIAPLLDLARAQ